MDYVDKIRENTKKYIQGLLNENDELCKMLSELNEINRTLKQELENLSQSKQKVQGELLQAQAELEEFRKEKNTLNHRLGQVEEERREFTEQYVEVEKQISDLANLYVACSSIHSTLLKEEVLARILEIVANFIGSEQSGIWLLNEDKTRMDLVHHMGTIPSQYTSLSMSESFLCQLAAEKKLFVSIAGNEFSLEEHSLEKALTLCIPLVQDDELIGCLGVFGLLPQKTDFEDIDSELFELLMTHAPIALTSAH